MGNKNTKSSLRNAIIYLNISATPIKAHDDKFWAQIFTEEPSIASDVIKSITTQEIRMLRDGSPRNFATLAYKMVERLCLSTGTLCNTHSQQTAVLNATRVLIRIIPCMFEDQHWGTYFEDNIINPASDLREEPKLVFTEKPADEINYASYLPARLESATATSLSAAQDTSRASLKEQAKQTEETSDLIGQISTDSPVDPNATCEHVDGARGKVNVAEISHSTSTVREKSLMESLISSICDLLFCPEFTVLPHANSYLSNTIDAPPEDLKCLSTCDYVWEPGVGFDSNINSTTYYDKNRSELLRLLLACLSPTLYETPESSVTQRNQWIELFASRRNRHALPLFTSLLNVVLVYRPSRAILPLNSLLYEDNREELVELAVQILIAVLDYGIEETTDPNEKNKNSRQNLFIDYMTRIHRKEDFDFLVKGFSQLLGDRLEQGYLLTTRRYIECEQELLILFWKVCSLNQKFILHLLRSNELLDIVIPILYHLNENFQDPSKTAIIHICVFILLILSGERNFGVKLNKPYTSNSLANLPDFTGSHADLLIIIFHKLIMYGYDIDQLYDFLLTIVANISPYLKGMTMLASKCLIQLFETFSSVFVLFTEPNYHPMVVFLLEIFNNLIQYQFDGNANLVSIILNKRNLFIDLANLSTSQLAIDKVLKKLIKRKQRMKMMTNSSDPGKQQAGEITAGNHSASSSSSLKSGHRSLATISSGPQQNARSSNQQQTRQEVSLVATPDLNHITQQIHPFDGHHGESLGPNEPKSTPSISLDDILNESIDSKPSDLSTTENNLIQNGPYDCVSAHEEGKIIEQQVEFKLSSEMTAIDLEKSPTDLSSGEMTAGKWRPTSDWLRQWKQTLPMQTVLRMIEVLVPQVEQLSQQLGAQDEAEVIKFLQSGTLVGLLPVPHPILIRKYRTNSAGSLWFRACTWGVIYVRNSIWTETRIQLINIV